MEAVESADPSITANVAAIDEPNSLRPYGSEVRWRIQQGKADNYRAASLGINASKVDIVNVQHEFGLYGTWKEGVYTDHLRPFLETITKPVITGLHTVPPDPTPSIREAVRRICALSEQVVVMADAAVELLARDYGIVGRITVIPHGMPPIEPHGRVRMKKKLAVPGRTLISTFGLVDPRKGLEYMIEAMPAILARHPSALYLIAGQTHPEYIRQNGERYRNSLAATVDRLGLTGSVGFFNLYMAQREIIELLLATDVYVTPYLDPQQITSGTLAYALGAGKAIVSTPYLHAKEALADDRGILVAFRDPGQLADAVNSLLDDPERKKSLERAAYAYARDMAWPKSGARWADLMVEVVARSKTDHAKALVAGASHA